MLIEHGLSTHNFFYLEADTDSCTLKSLTEWQSLLRKPLSHTAASTTLCVTKLQNHRTEMSFPKIREKIEKALASEHSCSQNIVHLSPWALCCVRI